MALIGAVDTNVLLRFLLKDDGSQLEAVQSLFRRAAVHDELLYVPVTVMLELEWVLRSIFKFSKHLFIQMGKEMLSSAELQLEAEEAVESALESYSSSAADYADCLHTALAVQADRRPFWTFDKTASRLEGARLLTAPLQEPIFGSNALSIDG